MFDFLIHRFHRGEQKRCSGGQRCSCQARDKIQKQQDQFHEELEVCLRLASREGVLDPMECLWILWNRKKNIFPKNTPSDWKGLAMSQESKALNLTWWGFGRFGEIPNFGNRHFFSQQICRCQTWKMYQTCWNIDSNWTTKSAIKLIGSRTVRQKFDSPAEASTSGQEIQQS